MRLSLLGRGAGASSSVSRVFLLFRAHAENAAL